MSNQLNCVFQRTLLLFSLAGLAWSVGCVTNGGDTELRSGSAALNSEPSQTSAGQSADLADGLEDHLSVNSLGSYRILDLPGVGGFYLPAELLSNLRRDRVSARVKLRTSPHDAAALRSLAVYELAVGNPAGARSFISVSRAGGSGKDSVSASIMGLAHLGLGEPMQARKEFGAAEKSRDGFILSHLNQGLYALVSGSAFQAASHFQQVVNVDKRNTLARLHLGQAYYVQRKFKLALAQFDEAILYAPENALIHFNRGIVLHRGMREFGEARRALRKVIASNEVGTRLKIRASGALQNLDRDEQGSENLATIGAF